MNEPESPERPSVLGSPDLPNANNRVIATVLGVCVVAVVLLALVVAVAVTQPSNPPAKLADRSRQIAARSVPRAAPPSTTSRNLSAPVRGDPASFFVAEDYPAEALRRGEQGRTVARLTLDTAGTPTRCDVQTSSGSASLDATTCRIALARVRYSPARDQEGRPVASSVTLPVRWVLPEAPPSGRPARERGFPSFLGLLMLAGFAFEGFTIYRGWSTGRINAPRSSSTAVRETSPSLFATYLTLHFLFAGIFGTGAILFVFGG